jgi:hypothetical protein
MRRNQDVPAYADQDPAALGRSRASEAATTKVLNADDVSRSASASAIKEGV